MNLLIFHRNMLSLQSKVGNVFNIKRIVRLHILRFKIGLVHSRVI